MSLNYFSSLWRFLSKCPQSVSDPRGTTAQAIIMRWYLCPAVERIGWDDNDDVISMWSDVRSAGDIVVGRAALSVRVLAVRAAGSECVCVQEGRARVIHADSQADVEMFRQDTVHHQESVEVY